MKVGGIDPETGAGRCRELASMMVGDGNDGNLMEEEMMRWKS